MTVKSATDLEQERLEAEDATVDLRGDPTSDQWTMLAAFARHDLAANARALGVTA